MLTPPRRISLGCLLAPLGLIDFTGVISTIFVYLGLPIIGYWLSVSSSPAPADAIVVLAGDQVRIRYAVDAYQRGQAPEIWYTGDVSPVEQILPTESQLARQAFISMGTPSEAIHLLPTTSTWEDGQQIAAYADERGVKRILLITSWYHGRRGLCVVRHHLKESEIVTYYQAAYNRAFSPANWWLNEEGLMAVSGELIKFGYYWMHYGLAPWMC